MTTFVLNVTLSHTVNPGDRIVINVSDDNVRVDSPPSDDIRAEAPAMFFGFAEEIVGALLAEGRVRTAETYRCMLNSFRRFRDDTDISIGDIDADVMGQYERWLHDERRLADNTVGFYMRKMRAVYNRAVARHLTPDRHPFAMVYTGQAKTRKRALTLDDLRRLHAYPADEGIERLAIDMFFLSFYTRGMALVDMAYLRGDAVRGGYIAYVRRKTGQRLVVRLTPQADDILARYHSPTGVYVLPMIQRVDGTERKQYRSCQNAINRALKAIGRRLGIDGLTLYTARHSWASMARQADVPMETISRCMGHTSERTTRIYIREFDSDTLHWANTKVIGMLNQ